MFSRGQARRNEIEEAPSIWVAYGDVNEPEGSWEWESDPSNPFDPFGGFGEKGGSGAGYGGGSPGGGGGGTGVGTGGGGKGPQNSRPDNTTPQLPKEELDILKRLEAGLNKDDAKRAKEILAKLKNKLPKKEWEALLKFLAGEGDVDILVEIIEAADVILELFEEAKISLGRFLDKAGKYLGPITFLITMMKGMRDNNSYRGDFKKFMRDMINALLNSFMPFVIGWIRDSDGDPEPIDLWNEATQGWVLRYGDSFGWRIRYELKLMASRLRKWKVIPNGPPIIPLFPFLLGR